MDYEGKSNPNSFLEFLSANLQIFWYLARLVLVGSCDQIDAHLVTHLVYGEVLPSSHFSAFPIRGKGKFEYAFLCPMSASCTRTYDFTSYLSPAIVASLSARSIRMAEEKKRKASSALALSDADKEIIARFAATHPGWDGKMPLSELLQQLNQPTKRFSTTQLSKLLNSHQIGIAASLRMNFLSHRPSLTIFIATALTPQPLVGTDPRYLTPGAQGAPLGPNAIINRAYQIANTGALPALAAAAEAKPELRDPQVEGPDVAFVEGPHRVLGWISDDNHFVVALPKIPFAHVTAKCTNNFVELTYNWHERELGSMVNPSDIPLEKLQEIARRSQKTTLAATTYAIELAVPRGFFLIQRTGKDITPSKDCKWVMFQFDTDLTRAVPPEEVEHHADDELH